MSEATALPTEPRPLPSSFLLLSVVKNPWFFTPSIFWFQFIFSFFSLSLSLSLSYFWATYSPSSFLLISEKTLSAMSLEVYFDWNLSLTFELLSILSLFAKNSLMCHSKYILIGTYLFLSLSRAYYYSPSFLLLYATENHLDLSLQVPLFWFQFIYYSLYLLSLLLSSLVYTSLC